MASTATPAKGSKTRTIKEWREDVGFASDCNEAANIDASPAQFERNWDFQLEVLIHNLHLWTEAKFWTKHDLLSIAMRGRAELAASNTEQTWSRGPK